MGEMRDERTMEDGIGAGCLGCGEKCVIRCGGG